LVYPLRPYDYILAEHRDTPMSRRLTLIKA